MDFVSPHFHVVEDKLPHAPAWTDPLPDPNDAPIWTAARRAGAHVIVTQNLKDGPPENEHGLRLFDGVLYLDPARLQDFLKRWGNVFETGQAVEESGEVPVDESGAQSSPDEIALSPAIRDFLLDLERRRGGELPPSDT